MTADALPTQAARPARPAGRGATPVLRRLHRWLGLGLGAWFALLGLTGSLLVFTAEIETWGQAAPGPGPAQPLAALVEAARASGPEGLLRVWPPAGAGQPLRADFRDRNGRVTRYLDPSSGAVLGTVRQGSLWIHWVHDLHRGLLLGGLGDLLVGLLGLPLLALLLAGLALWLQRDAVPWREKLVAVGGLRGRRRLANQHRAFGLRVLLPLLVAVVTGIGMAFPDTVQWGLYRLIRWGTPPGSAAGAGPVDLEGAVRLAGSLRPGWQVQFIDLPVPGRTTTIGVELAPPAPWPGQGISVQVDPATGALPEIGGDDPVGRIRGWIVALHDGTVLGLPHRLALAGIGALPLVMGWLGLRLWWRSRQAKRQVRRRAAAA